jgi:hypothetical protein
LKKGVHNSTYLEGEPKLHQQIQIASEDIRNPLNTYKEDPNRFPHNSLDSEVQSLADLGRDKLLLDID